MNTFDTGTCLGYLRKKKTQLEIVWNYICYMTEHIREKRTHTKIPNGVYESH